MFQVLCSIVLCSYVTLGCIQRLCLALTILYSTYLSISPNYYLYYYTIFSYNSVNPYNIVFLSDLYQSIQILFILFLHIFSSTLSNFLIILLLSYFSTTLSNLLFILFLSYLLYISLQRPNFHFVQPSLPKSLISYLHRFFPVFPSNLSGFFFTQLLSYFL